MDWDKVKNEADDRLRANQQFSLLQQFRSYWREKWEAFEHAISPAIQTKRSEGISDFTQFFTDKGFAVRSSQSNWVATYRDVEVTLEAHSASTFGLYLRIGGLHKDSISVEMQPARDFHEKHKQLLMNESVSASGTIDKISNELDIMKHNANVADEALADYANAKIVYQDVHRKDNEYDSFVDVINQLKM